MKIAFIQPNLHTEYARPPLGLLSVATVCKQADHDVRIIDATLLNLSPEQTARLASDCEVVGITAMTPSIGEATAIADALLDKTVILGGVHASSFPEWCRDTGAFDYIVVGEGENVILDLLNKDKPKVTCQIVRGTPVNLNEAPLPDYSLIDVNAYKARYPHAVRTPWTIASTSRACIFDCTFCVSSVHGKRTKTEWQKYAMDATRMYQLVKTLQNDQGIKDITFYDDLFTLDKNRVTDFCDLIKDSTYGADITWTCESRVNFANPEMLAAMQGAGCRLIYYGIESGSQPILNRLNKGQTLEQIRLAVKNTQEAGIKAAGYFMLGCPGETRKTVTETIAFASAIKLDHAQFSICSPLPGSRLWDEYSSLNKDIPDWSEFRYLGGNGNKPMFTTEEITREYLERIVAKANKLFTDKVKV